MRQYIGARYVPKYYEGTNGNAWEQNVAYEALTVVTYLSASYTSKKAVPATVGNPADNPNYWVLTANFPGQIGELTNTVSEHTQEINEINETISEEVEAINEKIYSLAAGLASRRFLLVGDSYGMRHTNNWISLAQQYLNVVTQNGVSGAGFGITTEALRFTTILQNLTNNLTQAQRESVTDIVICGGWNDARAEHLDGLTASELQNRILECVAIRNQYYPDAKLHIGFIGWQTFNAVQVSETTAYNLNSVKFIYDNIVRPGLYHLQNCGYVMRNYQMMDETYFHPADNKAIYLFEAIFGEIYGNSCYENFTAYTQADLLDDTSTTVNGFACTVATLNHLNHFKSNFFTVNKETVDSCSLIFNHPFIPLANDGEQVKCNVYIDGNIYIGQTETGTPFHGTLCGIIGRPSSSTVSEGKLGLKLIYNGTVNQIKKIYGTMSLEALYSTNGFHYTY